MYDAWGRGDFQLVTSLAQIVELRRVLAYERLRPYIRQGDAQTLSDTISAAAIVVGKLRRARHAKNAWGGR